MLLYADDSATLKIAELTLIPVGTLRAFGGSKIVWNQWVIYGRVCGVERFGI